MNANKQPRNFSTLLPSYFFNMLTTYGILNLSDICKRLLFYFILFYSVPYVQNISRGFNKNMSG